MRIHLASTTLLATFLLAACSHQPQKPVQAHAQLQPIGDSGVTGKAQFTEQSDGSLLVTARVEGLGPNASYGFHVHENGSCQNQGDAAGGHFNPAGTPHGKYTATQHHAGDLPSLRSDSNGIATVYVLTPNLGVAAGPKSVESRALIVHAQADDYQSQPSGNAGARIACAVIAK